MSLVSKLPDVTTSIFTVMSRLSAEHGAINLSQGFPDFACPEALIDRVTHHMRAGQNQYAPMAGVAPLRRRIVEKTKLLTGIELDPESEITITSGATEALFAAIHAVVRAGDEVILFDPAYDSYAPAIRLAGGVPVHLSLRALDYRIDWQAVHDSITPRTRLVILNSPHNPTGTVLRAADLDALEALLQRNPLWVLSDEVYEHIVFDGHTHQSMLRRPLLRSRSFVVSSFGKTLHATGWKVGYCVAPAALTAELRKVHQFLTFTTCTPIQLAIADFLEREDHYLGLPAFYQEKRDRFREGLRGSRFEVLPCEGTYFQLLRYANVSRERDTDLARRMTTDLGLASIPVSAFHRDGRDDKVLRFCFAKEDETLHRATEILRKM